jgi:hypothetical protein
MDPEVDTSALGLTPDPNSGGTAMVAVVVACTIVVVMALCIAVFFCCWSRNRHRALDSTLQDTKSMQQFQSATSDLIPPVFYTEGLRDPLMQEDLREKVQEDGHARV